MSDDGAEKISLCFRWFFVKILGVLESCEKKTYFGTILRKLSYPIRRSRLLKGYGGFFTFVRGLVRGPYYRLLQRLYHFDRWHIRPIEIRYYALDLCKHLNEFIAKQGLKTVVEIGCGIGDILARIKADHVVGFGFGQKCHSRGPVRAPKSRIP